MYKVLKKAGFEEKFFHTGEVIMNYVVGPDNGIPLVFIPGQAMTWEEYVLIMPKLVNKFQVYAVSVRGHGKSSWTPGKYTFNQLGQDMTAFINGVIGKPAIIAGNSSGGVLTSWLAANSSDLVKAIILEDPPLFRCEWPAIKNTVVYDMFLGYSKMAVAGGGGYAGFLRESVDKMANIEKGIMDMKMPPKSIMKIFTWIIAMKQAFSPGSPVDIRILPLPARIFIKSNSQFDGNFSRAFTEGTMGMDFDHAQTLSKIIQPVLFLHSNWVMHNGRLLGALDDNDVERIKTLVKGPWKYVKMECGHAIAMEKPTEEANIIINWADENIK
ncbi:MAG: alpha/beta hydrolase [Treponema sp.]|jgi:pimeloyl-ACP methyl ester carboxylesterase|nr:alpha/beta hydrolase [Treponema sp.]